MFEYLTNAVLDLVHFTALASITSVVTGTVALAVLYTLLFATPLLRLKRERGVPRRPVRSTRALLRQS